MITIKDVAKKAGVSISTVSNVINGKGAIGTEKYKRVKAAMEELDYHPSFIAQNLRNNRSHLIGVILPTLDESYSSMFQGIDERLNRYGYFPIVKLTENNHSLEENAVKQLAGLGVSGMILTSCSPKQLCCRSLLQSQRIPLVLLDRDIAQLDCPKVMFDKRAYIYERTALLLKREPNTRLLLIRYKEALSCDEACTQGFQQAYQKNMTEHSILSVKFESVSYFNQIYTYLQEHGEQIDQIITTDPPLAQAVSDAADLIGKSYPIHVLTGDNWQISRRYSSLKPIEQNTIYGGMQAASLLVEQLRDSGSENRTVKIKPKLLRKDAAPFLRVPTDTVHILSMDCTAISVLERLSSVSGREVGVNVQFEKLPPTELTLAVEQELLEGRSEHDLFMIDMPWLQHIVNQDLLYDISDKIAEEIVSSFPEAIQRTFYKNLNHRNIVPIIAGIQALYYRRDIFNDPDHQTAFFQRYGIQLGAPHNWKEFNYICEFFTRAHNPDSPFEYGTAMTTNYDINLANEYLPRQWAFHGHFVDEWGAATLNDDANYRALESIRATYRYSFNQAMNDNLDDDVFSLLLEGKIPMAHGFANHYIPEKYADTDGGADIKRHIVVCEAPGRSSLLSGWALGVNRNSKRVPACCAYLKWLMTDRIAVSNMRLGGCIPTLAVHENADLRIQYPWLNLMTQAFSGGRTRNVIYDRFGNLIEPVQLDYIIANALREAFSTPHSSRDILAGAQERLSSLIR